jgi:tetratricopeptide (TPR) repeat protein
MAQNESCPPTIDEESQAPQTQIEVEVGRGAKLRRVLIAGRDIVVFKRIITVFTSTPQVVAVLAFTALVVSLASAAYWLSQQPSRLKGDFNIVVAQFREIQDGVPERTNASERIGQALYDFLDGEYKRTDFGLKVEVGRRNMPYVTGDPDAETLARRTNAHLVIYGTLTPAGDQVILLPRFFVVREIQGNEGSGAEIGCDVDEIVGAHPFTLKLRFDPNASDDEVERDLATRAAVLSSFTQGLVHLSNDRPEPALAAFDEALRQAEGQEDFQGLQALYLFAAVANRRLGDYETALALLDQALEIKQNYGRASVALGNVYFSQAVTGCQSNGLDEKALELCQAGPQGEEDALWYLLYKARETYERVTQEGQHPYGAFLQEKGLLGVGNVHLWAAQNGEAEFGLFDRAVEAYQQVVASYEKTPDEGKRDLVALAYRYIGAAREFQGMPDEAEEAYRQCIELAHYDDNVKHECQTRLDDLQHGRQNL